MISNISSVGAVVVSLLKSKIRALGSTWTDGWVWSLCRLFWMYKVRTGTDVKGRQAALLKVLPVKVNILLKEVPLCKKNFFYGKKLF